MSNWRPHPPVQQVSSRAERMELGDPIDRGASTVVVPYSLRTGKSQFFMGKSTISMGHVQ